MTKPPKKHGFVNIQKTNRLPSGESTYLPKFLYTTLTFPEDKRSPEDRALDKPCEEFLIFANDVHTWGAEDAIGYWHSMTTKDLPVHPGDCTRCPKVRNHSLTLAFVSEEKFNEARRRAAEVVRTIMEKRR